MPTYRVIIDGEGYVVDVPDPNERPVRAIIDGEVFEVEVTSGAAEPAEAVDTTAQVAEAPKQAAAPSPAVTPATGAGATGEVRAPLPGTIVSISVSEGDTVERGQELCVLEAMKMNNPIRATQAGVVEEILITVGQQVQHGTPLMTVSEV